ncbi:MAG TPA: circadian clock protein KaiC [Solibacterales bacterium]|nr:circadian clock protein KaiC [Bryobacterales bacterium]
MLPSETTQQQRSTAKTGIPGLDEVLCGGFPADRLYLLEGDPGTGKTTIALQFLLEGVRLGEACLYITLSETEDELQSVAQSHGWSLHGVSLYELQAQENKLNPEQRYTIFHPVEVELDKTMNLIFEEVKRVNPKRVVFDSLSEMRLLAHDSLRFRRQILALKQFFAKRETTVLLLDDNTIEGHDLQLQSICHGVLALESRWAEFGPPRRKLRVVKVRGLAFREGDHDFAIRRGGVYLYPQLPEAGKDSPQNWELVSSGMAQLDSLLGGGLNRGSSALLLGPSGCGKSTLATLYACAAAERGEKVAVYIFEENRNIFLRRAQRTGLPVEKHVAAGRITLNQVDPAELSPGEFAHLVRQAVTQDKARMVIIDSVNGYLNAMPSQQALLLHIHELLTYLGQQQVLTFLVVAQHGLVGSAMASPVDVSYLADSVVLLRYFETGGAIRQALSVVKKRDGGHERTVRELQLTAEGPTVGAPLKDFEGVLSGTPVYRGPDPLLAKRGDPLS